MSRRPPPQVLAMQRAAARWRERVRGLAERHPWLIVSAWGAATALLVLFALPLGFLAHVLWFVPALALAFAFAGSHPDLVAGGWIVATATLASCSRDLGAPFFVLPHAAVLAVVALVYLAGLVRGLLRRGRAADRGGVRRGGAVVACVLALPWAADSWLADWSFLVRNESRLWAMAGAGGGAGRWFVLRGDPMHCSGAGATSWGTPVSRNDCWWIVADPSHGMQRDPLARPIVGAWYATRH